MITRENQFHFTRSRQLDQVTVLQAQMNDFTYGKHAHEEYSFGVTLAGRQDFFSSGAFHRSLPGNIIVINPGEVHDGHSGLDDTLRYRMVYIHPGQLEPMLATAGVKHSRDFQVANTLISDTHLRQRILNMALEDVVFEYGFSDLSHFNRRFKPIYGMTPRQYQQHFSGR